ncbi:MAG: squalene synthase HpnC [Gammaproteobacteria bacterium]|nr:MAG: squalene synthase HpnC [Gammaproteobacteria bacterium]
MTDTHRHVRQGYRDCIALAQSHYENFPVYSILVKKSLRPAVAVIYAFARRADDLADEGDMQASERIQALETMSDSLEQIAGGQTLFEDFLFTALADVICRHHLSIQPFQDLLIAFCQDVSICRYRDYAAVEDYCRHSANPVGRLMLQLHGIEDKQNIYYADQLCSALQWINFLQDLEQDFHEMQRIYLPEEDLQAFGVDEQHFENKKSDSAMCELVLFQIERTRRLLLTGLPLEKSLRGRFRWLIRTILRCGYLVLDYLETSARQGEVFRRPRLARFDLLRGTLLLSHRRLDRQRKELLVKA